MITINLANPEESTTPYKVIDFSDSQKLIKLMEPKRVEYEDILIKSRMSWNDLQLIIQTVAVLNGLNVASIELEVPYFLGARSDRKFDKGGTNYMKNVIAPIINNLKVDTVHVQDPHSIAIENCVDDVEIKSVLNHLISLIAVTYGINNFSIVAPDEGAIKRTEAIVAKRGKHIPIVKSLKHRDSGTGKIIGTEVLGEDLQKRTMIVVDDICDGGGTFIPLAEKLKEKNAGDLYLCVSHGIFSKGFEELNKHYKAIITTNSVREFTQEEQKNVIVHKVI